LDLESMLALQFAFSLWLGSLITVEALPQRNGGNGETAQQQAAKIPQVLAPNDPSKL
jgi:hypothetical protein